MSDVGELEIFHLSLREEDALLDDEDCPRGYYVVAETEVKARNIIRKYVSAPESEVYKKTARRTECKNIGQTYGGINPGVLAVDFGD